MDTRDLFLYPGITTGLVLLIGIIAFGAHTTCVRIRDHKKSLAAKDNQPNLTYYTDPRLGLD